MAEIKQNVFYQNTYGAQHVQNPNYRRRRGEAPANTTEAAPRPRIIPLKSPTQAGTRHRPPPPWAAPPPGGDRTRVTQGPATEHREIKLHTVTFIVQKFAWCRATTTRVFLRLGQQNTERYRSRPQTSHNGALITYLFSMAVQPAQLPRKAKPPPLSGAPSSAGHDEPAVSSLPPPPRKPARPARARSQTTTLEGEILNANTTAKGTPRDAKNDGGPRSDPETQTQHDPTPPPG